MIEYAQALALILEHARPLGHEMLAPGNALGRIVAAPVISPADLPPFDNSAMDGYALATAGVSIAADTALQVTAYQAAGDPQMSSISGACEIMTGARIPDGLDAVIPIEQTMTEAQDASGRPQRIRLIDSVHRGQHLRQRGSDVASGEVLLNAGDKLGAAQSALLAALGVANIAVIRRPRVAIICTGHELVDDPAQPLQSGQIRNSNGPYLQAACEALGADVVYQVTVSDEAGIFIKRLQEALQTKPDLVLSTGAVSAGRYDFIPAVLYGLGACILFHKVAIRPGKPLLFARLADGTPFFGLPGNPVATAIGLRFFVAPLLRRLLRLPDEPILRVPLTSSINKKKGWRYFQKAVVSIDSKGHTHVTLLPGQESFRLKPLLSANAWAILPEDTEQIEADTLVDIAGITFQNEVFMP